MFWKSFKNKMILQITNIFDQINKSRNLGLVRFSQVQLLFIIIIQMRYFLLVLSMGAFLALDNRANHFVKTPI